ncbi:MAG: methyltransferase, TIGR04325 family [Actinomycetota bacterium]
MFLWVNALLPEPLKIGLRGILAPIIGFRVAENWESAVSESSGYQSPQTISTIEGSDPVVDKRTADQNFLGNRYLQVASAILSGLNPEELKSKNTIRVLDIGGGLGEYFFLLRDNLPNLKFEWLILETPALCELAKSKHADTSGISWTNTLNDSSQTFDIVLLSSVIQYVEKPFVLIEMAMQKAPLLIFNRLPFSAKPHNLVCIQRPGLFESKGSYPVHILSEQLFISYLSTRGQIMSRWLVPEDVAVVRFRKIMNQGLTFRPHTSTAV